MHRITRIFGPCVDDISIFIIKSFLQERQFRIKFYLYFEIRQNRRSSRLLPIIHLYAVCINDMSTHPDSRTALFVDDTLFYATSTNNNSAVKKVQKQIDLTQTWFSEWKLSVNVNKTSAIIFSHKSTRFTNKIKINNTSINWSNSMKYLGVYLDRKLTFNKHVNNIITKAKRSNFCLYSVINEDSPLPTSTKSYIFKSYIRTILTYAGPV